MKKNPFAETIVAVPLPQAKPYWRLTKLDDPCLFLDMTKEQAEYAAEAINKHEEMVAMLDKHQWVDSNTFAGHRCPECKAAKRVGHADDCALDALLKEENRDG